MIDEYGREFLAIETWTAPSTRTALCAASNGSLSSGALPPTCASVQGRSFIAHAVGDWCRCTDTFFIDTGSPWQNAWIESFDGRLRDEFLNGQLFDTVLEARILLEDWRIDYNLNRSRSAHDELIPTEFVQSWLNQQQLQ